MASKSTATLLRKARAELWVIASYKDEPWLNAGLAITAKAYQRLIDEIDQHLAELEADHDDR